MPSNVLILIVRLPRRWQPVIRICDFAFNVTSVFCGLDIVIVYDPLSADNDARTKFPKDGSRSNDTDSTALVRMGNDFSINQIPL